MHIHTHTIAKARLVHNHARSNAEASNNTREERREKRREDRRREQECRYIYIYIYVIIYLSSVFYNLFVAPQLRLLPTVCLQLQQRSEAVAACPTQQPSDKPFGQGLFSSEQHVNVCCLNFNKDRTGFHHQARVVGCRCCCLHREDAASLLLLLLLLLHREAAFSRLHRLATPPNFLRKSDGNLARVLRNFRVLRWRIRLVFELCPCRSLFCLCMCPCPCRAAPWSSCRRHRQKSQCFFALSVTWTDTRCFS